LLVDVFVKEPVWLLVILYNIPFHSGMLVDVLLFSWISKLVITGSSTVCWWRL